MRASTLRWLVAVVCVSGIAGMIVFSVADNNGGAMTFGILTAIASLVLLSVTAVLKAEQSADAPDRPAAPPSPGAAPPTPARAASRSPSPSPSFAVLSTESPGFRGNPGTGSDGRGDPHTGTAARGIGGAVDEDLAQWVEVQVERLVAGGAEEAAVRALVGDAVRLGRGR
jgi:hypothetical protein